MNPKTAFLGAVIVAIVLWAVPSSNDLFQLIETDEFEVHVNDEYKNNLQIETIKIKKLGISDAENVLVLINSYEEKEIVGNLCTEGEVIISDRSREISLKFDRMLPNYECELKISSSPDSDLRDITIIADDVPKYEWSRHDQEWKPIWMIVGIIVLLVFGSFAFFIIKLEFIKTRVSYYHYGSISLEELTEEYGEGFTETDVLILKTIKNGKKDIQKIVKHLNMPKKDIMKRLKFMEKNEILNLY